MKAGWQHKKIGDLCEVIAGQSPDGNFYNSDGKGKPFYQGKKGFGEKLIGAPTTWTTQVTKIAQKGDILMSVRAPVGPVNFATDEICIGRGLAAIRSNPELDRDFLFYQMLHLQPTIAGKEGAVFASISKSEIEALPLSFPPLPEQRRIVGILDEALDGIAIAKANAEKNLQNARALFESHLQAVFIQSGHGWEEKRLGNESLIEIVDGDRGVNYPKATDFHDEGDCLFLNTKNVRPDGFDFTSTMFITAKKDGQLRKGKLKRDDVVLTTRGTIGYVGHYSEDVPFDDIRINSGMLIFRPNKRSLLPSFLFELLRSEIVKEQIKKYTTGAAQPQLPIKTLVNFTIPVPKDLKDQRALVAKLRAFEPETQRLASFYQQKLAALAELKKSLLHQAFSSELTKASVKAAVIPFPIAISNITTTDLHAGILAMAYQMHEKHGRQSNYGHVKAEKIAHMIEAYVGIDLGRNPVKDAAGPNDFQHLMKVESRARKARFFDFKRVKGSAYRVTKYRQFDSLITRARQALGDRIAAVDRLLAFMLPMDTQQAQIFCTVYAAWNNLMLDQQQPITDEQIVLEAREHWHPEKLKIPRGKFFSAIEWLREKGLTPLGRGKKVNRRAK